MATSKNSGSCTPKDCRDCETRHASALGGLNEEALAILDKGKSAVSVAKGEILFRVGDLATGLYCVGKGLIKTEVEGALGESRILNISSPGDFVGYTSVFNGGHQNSTASASEDSELCFIPSEALEELISKHPEFARSLLTKIVHDVKRAQKRLLDHEKNAFQRVAESVLFLVGRFPNHNWTRKEIADWAGTATETAIRVLSEFASEGWLRLEGRKIFIENREQLLKLAGVSPGQKSSLD
ncbi:Crp/Fnr family transcriptional regulator [bacterium]|nr:Crp/Fnr family transcriptional regulator [bacterium]